MLRELPTVSVETSAFQGDVDLAANQRARLEAQGVDVGSLQSNINSINAGSTQESFADLINTIDNHRIVSAMTDPSGIHYSWSPFTRSVNALGTVLEVDDAQIQSTMNTLATAGVDESERFVTISLRIDRDELESVDPELMRVAWFDEALEQWIPGADPNATLVGLSMPTLGLFDYGVYEDIAADQWVFWTNTNHASIYSVVSATIPEPASVALLALGLPLVLRRRR